MYYVNAYVIDDFVSIFIFSKWWSSGGVVDKLLNWFTKAKSRKYQGVFEVKSWIKTWQVQGIWSQQIWW